MIHYNTTFHVEKDLYEEFIEYLRSDFISSCLKSGLLASPRLLQVMGDENYDGYSIALEFKAKDMETLNNWIELEKDAIFSPLLDKFTNRFIGFSTILRSIEI